MTKIIFQRRVYGLLQIAQRHPILFQHIRHTL